MKPSAGWIDAGTWAELEETGSKVVEGILVFCHEGRAAAVDNRCPHLGFPLHQGTICEGILTCHWHHARFDVCSGGTLDPWADDVPAHEVRVEEGRVLVSARPRQVRDTEKHKIRLREGLEQNIGIVTAKAIVGLIEGGVAPDEIARIGLDFGTKQGDGWGSGLTILTAMRNVLPDLDRTGQILALYHGLTHVARASAGKPPRHLLGALPAPGADPGRLYQWYRNCAEVRDTQGAEKVLLTAIESGMDAGKLADMMLAAVTDHVFLDGGHTFDFHNKAFEALRVMGGEAAGQVLASLVPGLGNPTRSEELHHWQAPVNLVEPLRKAVERLKREGPSRPGGPTLAREQADALEPAGGPGRQTGACREAESPERPVDEPAGSRPAEGRPQHAPVRSEDTACLTSGAAGLPARSEAEIVDQLLSDRPLETLEMLTDLLIAGSPPARLAQLIALAASERIVRFHTQSDFGDWIAVLHTFTYAHAVHERLLVSDQPELNRALLHGAMAVYHDRFLNVPRAARPKVDPEMAILEDYRPDRLLELLDRRQQVEDAARWTAGYLKTRRDPAALIHALGHALLREDAEFHSFQLFEASVAEYKHWLKRSDSFAVQARETLLLACTRYLAAHAPTARELPQTARIAWRLYRGDRLFEEE